MGNGFFDTGEEWGETDFGVMRNREVISRWGKSLGATKKELKCLLGKSALQIQLGVITKIQNH